MIVDVGGLIPVILSAGGGAFLVSLVQGWRDARKGVRDGQRETVIDLMEWRDDLEEKRKSCAADSDYWRDLCAQRGYQLRQAGITPHEPDPLPPSERRNRPERDRGNR